MIFVKKTYLHLIILLALSLILFFLGLGSAGLMEPDEGRNAEVAREILATGDWVTPHLDFIRYLDKPILYFWASAASMKIFGVSEFAARFPSATAALIGVIAVYLLGRRMFGERAGLYSAIVLATSPLYLGLGRIVIFDIMLTAFITLAILFWYLGFTAPEKRNARLFYLSSWAAMALAVLTKGPIGAIFPMTIIGLFLIMTRSLKRILEMELILGPLLFFVIAGPWYILVSIRNPEYPYYFFVAEHILRFATTKFQRTKPFWYYFPIVIGGLLPWIFFLPSAVRRFMQERADMPAQKREAILLTSIWALFIFIFFSISKAKMSMYILPMFPALALLTGNFWNDYSADKPHRRDIVISVFVLSILMILAGIGLAFMSGYLQAAHDIVNYYSLSALLRFIRPIGIAIAIFFIVSLSLFFYRRHNKTLQVFIFIASSLVIIIAGTAGIEVNGQRRSSKVLADRLLQELRPQDMVVMYECFSTSFLFYLARQIPVVSNSKGLLGSNFIKDYDLNYRSTTGPSIMDRQEFRSIVGDRKMRVYILTPMIYAGMMMKETESFGRPELLITNGKTGLWVRKESL